MKKEKKCNSKKRECFIREVLREDETLKGLLFIFICTDCKKILRKEFLEGDFHSALDDRYHGTCPICKKAINDHEIYHLRELQKA